MESDKIIYWMTLGVLAMATISGFATEHRGWSDRLADRSLALMSQASERAVSYAEIAGMVLGSQGDAATSPGFVVDVQNPLQNQVESRVACVQRVVALRRAEMTRLRTMRVQVRMLERAPRTIVVRPPDIVIEVPQPPLAQVDTF